MKPPSAATAYLIAIAATAAVVMLRWLLDPDADAVDASFRDERRYG